MSADNFTEISSSSWFSRIAASFKGILVGIILLVLSIALLSWNEGRAVKRYKTLKEGAGAVVTVDSGQIDAAREGELVHLSGFASTEDRPADSEFGVSAHALMLTRNVEMYQWKENKSSETRKKLGGGTETVTTYNYVKEWSDQHIESSNFKKGSSHANPAGMRYQTKTFTAKPVTLGAFTLSSSQVSMINGPEVFSFTKDYTAPQHLGETTISPTSLYLGKDSAAPEIGDLRVNFTLVPEQTVTVVSAQVENSFQPYQTSAGGTINLLRSGEFTSASMIQIAQDNNKFMTWALRGVGLLMMFFGFNLLMAPLSVLADIVPFIGSIVGAGTAIISFLLTLIGGLITIAVAWIVFRPVLAGSLLAVSIFVVYVLFKQMKSAKAQA